MFGKYIVDFNYSYSSRIRKRNTEIIRRYKKGATVSELVEQFGLSESHLRGVFEAAGMKISIYHRDAALNRRIDKQALLDAFKSGSTAGKLGEIYGVSGERMRQLLRDFPDYEQILKRNKQRLKEEEWKDFMSHVEKKGVIPSFEELKREGSIVKDSHYSRLRKAAEEKGFIPWMEAERQAKKKELIVYLRKLAAKIGRTPSVRDLAREGKYSQLTFRYYLGNLTEAQALAGLVPNKDGNPVGTDHGKPVSKEKYIKALRKIAKRLGRKPTWYEVLHYGKHSRTTYMKYLKSEIKKYVKYQV